MKKHDDRRAVKAAAANILALYLDAPEVTQEAGARWYALERERCAAFAAKHGRTLRDVAGAAAAISPGMRWEFVFAHLSALRASPKARVPTYSRVFVERALRCFAGEDPDVVLSGPKVRAFYALLSGADFDAVVIDGHAWNIARGEFEVFRRRPGYVPSSASRVTARRYRIAVAAYREVAEVLGLAPHAVQATTWIHWRALTARKG